jgi:hypothetical protein
MLRLLFLLSSASASTYLPRGVAQSNDWLVSNLPALSTTLTQGSTPNTIILSNGLLSRTFVTSPCFATVDLALVKPPSTFFRGLSPESVISLNGTVTPVGGCIGQTLFEWFDLSKITLAVDPTALIFRNYSTSAPSAPFPLAPGAWDAPSDLVWPPAGLHLQIDFVTGGAVPSANGTNFTQFSSFEFPCNDTCLIGWPSCDIKTVPGQCTFPSATAVSLCSDWPLCVGVTCNSARNDCQARGVPFDLTPQTGFTSFVRTTAPTTSGGPIVTVHYEMYDGIPSLRKWVTVSVDTNAPAPVTVDSLIIDLLRAPNFAPDSMTVDTVHANNPTPSSQQTVPDPSQAFPGRTQQLWFFDSTYDKGGDAELHVPYTYYTRLSLGYSDDVTFGGPTGPGVIINPGSIWESTDIRQVFHDTTDFERQGLGLRKVASLLTPQLLASPLHYMITDISSNASFQLAIDQAAAAGMEMIIIGYGAQGWCGMCDSQILSPSFTSWLKDWIIYATTKNIAVSAYTLMQHNGWGESVPEAEQVLNRDGSRGGIACFATDWHAAYRTHVLDFTRAVNLSGVETDGQYENAYCGDTGGDHHHNGGAGAFDAQLKATLEFNALLKEQGIYQTGADAYANSGSNLWNHADTDAGYSLPTLMERLMIGREYVYDSTTSRVKTSGSYGIGDISEESRECGASAARLACVDFALSSFFGLGVPPTVVAPSLVPAADSDAPALLSIFKSWTDFFKAHRTILAAPASLHLGRPTSRSIEATVHLSASPTATERAFIALINPMSVTMSAAIDTPLYYAGLAPNTDVSIWRVTAGAATVFIRNATVGNDGGGLFDVHIACEMPAQSYAFFVMTLL